MLAVELDVVGGHVHALLAQIFGQDAADLAIAEHADLPLPGIAEIVISSSPVLWRRTARRP